MNQEAHNDWLKSRGITKETIKQVAEAASDWNNGVVQTLNNVIVENPDVDVAFLNTRTANGIIKVKQIRKLHTKTPVTGEELTRYAVTSIKMEMKSKIDKDLLVSCENAVEKLYSKK